MQVLYLIGLLLLINAQVNSSPLLLQDTKITTKRIEQWAKDKAQMLINEIQESTGNLKSALEKHLTNGQSNIDKITSAAVHELNTRQQLISPECYQKNVEKLELVKTATFWEFVNCKNLTDAGNNTAQIIHETAKLTTGIITYVEQASSGLFDCRLGDYFADAECVTNYIWKVIDNVRSSIPEVKTYGDLMNELSDKIKAEIDYCLHPPLTEIDSQVKQIMEESKKCETENLQNVSLNK